MIVLGIETSCDETSAAVVKNGRQVLSNIIASQVDLHAPFGGVVPEIAARRHIECIGFIVDEALKKANLSLSQMEAYAVANGPGLAGALLVGLNYAKGLSFVNKKPLIGVNHIQGHVCANFLSEKEHEEGELKPPFLSLVVSGGHTLLLAVDDYNTYRVVGATRDDAAGEAFDKVARVLGLPYPGGPEIDKIAKTASPSIDFPRARVDGFDFSFSGLKTAVVQYFQKNPDNIPDIAASFQKAVVDVLIERAVAACVSEGYNKIALAGGVACNSALRRAMQDACKEKELQLFMPAPVFCTDNAAMIACRGYYRLLTENADDLDLNAFPGRMV
ncbi:MAG: tRNA (adenosine(37)-N6)-threonylcarbamoyltransferase complex transferase subunit TsaD [Clostridiales bacterium]|jgi:N6-L-threonylcarbamoyladenine synthase|nr:tRNA (adenosine(37)-N6)-threonylcarbamoyltransferase complex transferase subunit TsaD [Clostridiales bacterium]